MAVDVLLPMAINSWHWYCIWNATLATDLYYMKSEIIWVEQKSTPSAWNYKETYVSNLGLWKKKDGEFQEEGRIKNWLVPMTKVKNPIK